jgi:hypothetical protein
MNISDFKASLDYLVRAELTPFIWGHAGIGKTSVVEQYAKDKGYKFFAFYLGTQSDTGDILGLAEFVRDSKGRAVATEFAMPLWLRETIEYCEANPDSGAVIFLDEFNRARRDILQGMFSFALNKKFHTIQLPKNCHVIAAGNPPTDEYFVTDIDETALMGRFVHIKLEPTVQEWVDYAKAKEINSNLIGFIRNQPQLLEENRKDFKLPVKVDRRAFERLDKLFRLNTPQHLLSQLMQGIIGLERTVAYEQYLQNQDKPLSGAEVLTGEKLSVIEKWSNPKDTVASLLRLTCENLHQHLKNLNVNKTLLTKKQQKHLMEFLDVLPKDIAYACIDKITKDRIDGQLNETWKDFFNGDTYRAKMIDLVKTAKPQIKDAA